MIIRELETSEIDAAVALAWRVFQRYEAPEYTPAGVANFEKTIQDQQFQAAQRWYGAFLGNELIGMLATRNQGAHLSLFFVDEAYHRQGIGRSLFEKACANAAGKTLTVNSSPYAVDIYRRLGFKATKNEQLTDGIRYTPMCYTIINAQVMREAHT